MPQPPSVRLGSAALCFLTLLAAAPRAGGQPSPELVAPPTTDAVHPPDPTMAACDAATTERLDFLMTRLDERRTYARRWWMGFTGFYAIGTVVSSVQASQEGNSGQRANDAVGEVMTWSHPWHGVDDLAEYDARFPKRSAAARPDVAWRLVPTASGLALHLRF